MVRVAEQCLQDGTLDEDILKFVSKGVIVCFTHSVRVEQEHCVRVSVFFQVHVQWLRSVQVPSIL